MSNGRNRRAPARAIEVDLIRFSGARAVRIGDSGNSIIEPHSHDWPILSIYVLGEHEKLHDCGADRVSGPSATLHLPGASHANVVAEHGFEQVDIEFDPAWLQFQLPKSGAPISCWRGGEIGARAARLLEDWVGKRRNEADLCRLTAEFLSRAFASRQRSAPPWVAEAAARLRNSSPTVTELARMARLSPAWLPQAYRAHYGEVMADTRQRGRVEQALTRIRNTDDRLCDVAVDVGFFDQSHMTRAFRRVLGRTPAAVRAEYLGG